MTENYDLPAWMLNRGFGAFWGRERAEREAHLLESLAREPYDKLPASMLGPLLRWVLDGIPPGGFLRAVITDSLFDAATRADDTNGKLLREWAQLFRFATPELCHGSQKAMDAWTRYCELTREAHHESPRSDS